MAKEGDRRFMPDKVRRPIRELDQAAGQLRAMGYTVGGSYRRQKETVGDLDVIVRPDMVWEQAIRDFETLFAYEAIRGGDLKTEGIAQYRNAPLLVNLWRVPEWRNWKGMLLFVTGPFDFNIMMRGRAKGRGLLLSQYGLFRTDQDIQLDGPVDGFVDNPDADREIFDLLEMEFLLPVERENWKSRTLPKPAAIHAINVPASNGKDTYTVTIHGGKAVDCECKGFSYRSTCRHLAEAEKLYARR